MNCFINGGNELNAQESRDLQGEVVSVFEAEIWTTDITVLSMKPWSDWGGG